MSAIDFGLKVGSCFEKRLVFIGFAIRPAHQTVKYFCFSVSEGIGPIKEYLCCLLECNPTGSLGAIALFMCMYTFSV